MNQKTKITAFSIALTVIAAVVALFLLGSPLDRAVVWREAERYLSEQYPQMSVEISKITYDFQTGYYRAQTAADGSLDIHFSLTLSKEGKVISDSYGTDVLGKHNTLKRLSQEYEFMAASGVKELADEYELELVSVFLQNTFECREDAPVFGIDPEELTVDCNPDLKQLGEKAGVIRIWANSPSPSAEEAASLLMTIRDVMEGVNVPFRAVELRLRQPIAKDGTGESEFEIYIGPIFREDIIEKGLVSRIEEANLFPRGGA